MRDFADKLGELCSREQASARQDQDRMAGMIEQLAAALGMTIAIAVRGDPAAIDQVMTIAEAHAHREAVDKAPLGMMMANLDRRAS